MEPLLFKNLQVRLAETSQEVEAAQALRYRVFYEEMSAVPTPEMRTTLRPLILMAATKVSMFCKAFSQGGVAMNKGAKETSKPMTSHVTAA